MIPLFLLSVAIRVIEGSVPSLYSVLIPMSTGGGQIRHPTHLIPHPYIRTKILVLKVDGIPHNHGHNPNHHGYDHPPESEHSFNSDRSNNHQPNDQTVGEEHSNNHQRFKYSIPIEESPWKPIQGIKSNHYLPLQFLGEDKPGLSKVVVLPIRDHERDTEHEERNLILPVGIKKLHNPQLRIPVKKHSNSIYPGYDEGGSYYSSEALTALRSKSMREYPRFRTNYG